MQGGFIFYLSSLGLTMKNKTLLSLAVCFVLYYNFQGWGRDWSEKITGRWGEVSMQTGPTSCVTLNSIFRRKREVFKLIFMTWSWEKGGSEAHDGLLRKGEKGG